MVSMVSQSLQVSSNPRCEQVVLVSSRNDHLLRSMPTLAVVLFKYCILHKTCFELYSYRWGRYNSSQGRTQLYGMWTADTYIPQARLGLAPDTLATWLGFFDLLEGGAAEIHFKITQEFGSHSRLMLESSFQPQLPYPSVCYPPLGYPRPQW